MSLDDMIYQFDSDIANQYGVDEAIMIANLMYWIRKNEANGKHFHDGRYWTYNSIEAFVTLLPFWSEKQIKRILQSLVDKEVIVLGNYNSSTYDGTTWYAFGDSMLLNGGTQMGKPIPNIENTNNILLPKINISPKFEFDAILKSWNDNNGKAWGKVNLLTEKRKRAIVTLLENHKISDTQLVRLFAALPYSDDWLFHPTGQHKTWKPTFDWWIANTGSWFTRALEGGVHTNNPQAFKDIMEGNAVSAYHPQQSPSLAWDENNKVYIYIGFFDGRFIPDGYNDDNRPDGARILLNNARGIIQWYADKKEWKHIG